MDTNTATAAKTGSCPYAMAISDDDHTDDGSSSASSRSNSWKELALTKCPAFSNNNCPFKDSANIDKTLLSVPSSHLSDGSYLQQALGHLHKTIVVKGESSPQEEEQDSKYKLSMTQCPMKSKLTSTTPGSNSLLQDQFESKVFEQMSLSAIMAAMAQQQMPSVNSSSSLTGLMDVARAEEQDIPRAVNTTVAPTVSTSPTSTSSQSTTSPRARTLLSHALKTGTAEAHQAAENVHFVHEFIRGNIDRHLYGELVWSLYVVYEVLEQCLDIHAPVQFPTCHFPRELNRTEALKDDVDFWHGSLTAHRQNTSPATQDYMDRIRTIAQTKPLLLLSHAYTRYLGDLSGGKILARVARKALQLEKGDGNGLNFYEFDGIPSAKVFKDQYRTALNELDFLTDQDIMDLVQEANIAFLLNMRIFEELDVMAAIPGASVRSLEDVLSFSSSASVGEETEENKTENEAAMNKCPFIPNKNSNATASMGKCPAQHQQQHSTKKGERCPWPFVFLHDPYQGMKDWQTWVILGLMMCWVWSNVTATISSF
eukprot:CAMPEP_0195292690 /NCGR_PEP_ID=MMETSP0707-20130614/10557_1 /TAXON_ID=33640 /ORGANISM="Asterionellopsis glacialis, Strain CCMP134" /LENGTH=539 /DNA_ID=CAMNT_0040353219 /DNA_START=66 /DNA_END=1685 /DNA_ORIENTATION=+